MIIPFTEQRTFENNELVLKPMLRSPRYAPDLTILNKDGEEIESEAAGDGDRFTWGNRTVKGVFSDRSDPFRATMQIKYIDERSKGTYVLHEVGTDFHHIIYPSEMQNIFAGRVIDNGVFAGIFKYIRKGSVYCVKLVD